MDRKALVQSIKTKLREWTPKVALWCVILSVIGAAGFYISSGKFSKLFANTRLSFFEKLETIRAAEEENERLRAENTTLRSWIERAKFECSADRFKSESQSLSRRAMRETGAEVGRAIASIDYQMPGALQVHQLYTLGLSYFKAEEFEKSAVIFSHLTGLESSDQFRTPANLLMTGVSWYRIDHLTLAQDFFAKVAKLPVKPEVLPYQAQARLWLALVAKRQNKHPVSQQWLGELMENHPRSREAAWVNSTNGAELAIDIAKTEIATREPEKAPEKVADKGAEKTAEHGETHGEATERKPAAAPEHEAPHAQDSHGTDSHSTEAKSHGH